MILLRLFGCASLLVSAPTVAYAQHAKDLVAETSHSAEGAYLLTVRTGNGYTFNARAPQSARLRLILADGRRFDASQFRASPTRADLTIARPGTPLRGQLVALICRPDRCRRVELALSWEAP